MAFNDKPHWLIQIFGAAAEQAYEFATRDNQEKMSDALMSGHYRKVRRMINNGRIPVDCRDPVYGRTPLMEAVNWGMIYSSDGEARGHKKIITFLLGKNPDLTVVDKDGDTLWSLAEGCKDILDLLPPIPPGMAARQKSKPPAP